MSTLEERDRTRGSCQCARVTYALNTKALTSYACHCTECQKQSASAFALSVPVFAKDFTIQGKVRSYHRGTESGAVTHCVFCPSCGTRLYHQSERSPLLLTLKGGTLDEAHALVPVAHLWVRSMHRWMLLPDDVARFETQPDDLASWRLNLLEQHAG